MDVAKELIRTVVRTLFSHPKQILIIDAVLQHSVVDISDLQTILATQPKDIRGMINPLRSMRLIQPQERSEMRVGGGNRPQQRMYYYIPFHAAIDAIKFKIVKLRRKVEQLYQSDEQAKKKDYRCPRCKAEYETMEILDNRGPDGFYCDRCGATLNHNMEAAQANMDKASHEKIRKLNDQLKKFDDLIARIDRTDIPENDFESAWDRKKPVPKPEGSGPGNASVFMPVGSKANIHKKGAELVDAKNLTVNLTTGEEEEKAALTREEARKADIARKNILPSWHTSSLHASAGNMANGSTTPLQLNRVGTPASAESEEGFMGAGDDDDDEEEEEEDFEDVVKVETTGLRVPPVAGVKREASAAFEDDSEENEDFEDV
jgi:transcription initiation factor TFIIE subunit alpha